MKARIITSVAAAGVLALVVSCTQDQSSSISAPTGASLARVPAPTCSFSTASNDAKAYFSRQKDSVFTLLSIQSTAYKSGPAAARSAGLDVLRRLGVARDSGLIKSTATDSIGSKFANDVLLCTDLPYGIDFRASLGTHGLFAVRAVGDVGAVLSRFTLIDGSPQFGAEPTGDGTWQFTPADKALFYAAPVVTTITDPTVGTVFDLKTLPDLLTFSPAIRVGVCDMTITNGRIEHVHGAPVVLPPDLPTFCAPASGSLETTGSLFASATHEIISWLAPRTASAASRTMGFGFSGGGGLVSGLSEIGPVMVLDSLTISRIPNASVSDTSKALDADSTTSQFSPIVTVRAITKTGTPIVQVTVQLNVIGNKGSFLPSGGEAVTDSQGYARFPNFTINKAGGYTVTASIMAAENVAPFTVTSNIFNINGQ
jgi:hypothetical protein